MQHGSGSGLQQGEGKQAGRGRQHGSGGQTMGQQLDISEKLFFLTENLEARLVWLNFRN